MVHQCLVELGQLVDCLITHERLPHKQDKVRGIHSNQLGEERREGRGERREGRGERGEERGERKGEGLIFVSINIIS